MERYSICMETTMQLSQIDPVACYAIAARCGRDVRTVRKALSGSDKCKPIVRAAVLRAARELGIAISTP